jgi:MoxR-like ATPase/vacuolar-type H+-ATPase subunit E/Vma4
VLKFNRQKNEQTTQRFGKIKRGAKPPTSQCKVAPHLLLPQSLNNSEWKMTIAELAKKLNATVPEIFEHYKKNLVDIPEDENYVMTTEQIKKAIPKYEAEEKTEEIKSTTELKPKLGSTGLEDFKSKVEERRKKRIEILDSLEPFFKKGDGALLKEIKKHNSIPDFIFEGEYRKIEGNGFGFFKNISHQNGTILTYPVSNDSIDEIFIPTGELSNGKRYSFEATIARRNERTKKANPFLLQAKSENIKEIIELSAISQELKVKQEKLEEINTYLEKAEEHFEEKKEEIEEKVSKVLQEKQSEANEIIETYQETITQKFNEIQNKEKELSSLNETVEATNNHLQKMENLLSTLQDRVSLCRNLQFIREEDENKYLNLLSAKEFKPINHLDFEKDFENNFSKLSEHIHSYLYHKKNLIYTRYQIKNFLTLLKTHDIIVLSGLSGSGKTQIVKAFAEALGGVAKIIPVKPNWTSSDDLIGFYNPLQMSFLPTPFTEAIVEAINNPNQLYFICLDEMNLARAEYYFADFLSKLEERSKYPEIELYANHEEELFVSEFNTLLNLIESSIKGKQINSWQEFLNNEEARKKFFEMLGNTDKESMLQLHAKMRRRLIDILKFPSTIRIPDNIRFIGAINVDETTHYFSPKILDRIHIVKFDNPLLFEERVNSWFENTETEKELKPVYVQPNLLSERKEYPSLNNSAISTILQKLKEINQKFLLPLNIDFGVRSIRQALNYTNMSDNVFEYYYYSLEGGRTDMPDVRTYFNEENIGKVNTHDIALNSILIQKVFPRFIFDGSETAKNGETKIRVVEELQKFLANEFNEFYHSYESDETDIGKSSSEYLEEMIKQANRNNSQFNFFA